VVACVVTQNLLDRRAIGRLQREDELIANTSSKPVSRECASFRCPTHSRKKVNPHKIQQLAERIEAVEAAIHTHETRIAALAQMLAS
jgi:hypothetical protein